MFIATALHFCLEVYFWIIVASVAISWLIAFDVVNARNPKAQQIIAMLDKATEPVYRRIRKVVKPIGGIDIAPLIVIFGIYIGHYLVNVIFIGGLH